MEVYHISQSLQRGDTLTPDYEKLYQLAEPFLQGLERGLDCFTAMVLQGKYLYAVMSRSGLRYWADYAKYATEAVFEFVRRREFPQSYSRLGCAYFFDSEACCRNHFEMDYGEDPEEGAKVGLFQVELEDPAPQYRDMSVYDLAYEAMSQRQDVGGGIPPGTAVFPGRPDGIAYVGDSQRQAGTGREKAGTLGGIKNVSGRDKAGGTGHGGAAGGSKAGAGGPFGHRLLLQ